MRSKRVKVGLVLTVLLTAITLATCTNSPQVVTEPEKLTVTRGNIVQSIHAEGSLSLPLDRDRKLSFGTSGKIDQINVNEGDKVTGGMVLAKLDTATLERAVKTTELALSSAEIDRKQAEFSVRAAELDLEQASDNFRKISYPYTYSTFAFDVPAALDYITSAERQVGGAQKSLLPALTTDQYNEVSHQLKDAKDNLVNARERLARGSGVDVFASGFLTVKDFWTLRAAQLQRDKAEASLDNARNIADRAKLAIDKTKYDLDTAKDMLDKAIITAPFDGVVAEVMVKAGDILSTIDYTKTIIELVDPRYMELTINVDEKDIPRLKPGQEAIISVDAAPGTKPTGKVIFISPLSTIQAGVVLYKAKIGFDVPEGLGLSTGMSAIADIVTTKRTNTLMLPTRAINQNKSANPTVKLLVDGQVQEREVVTGISDSFNTEIISGLSEGDTVVIGRQVKLSLS